MKLGRLDTGGTVCTGFALDERTARLSGLHAVAERNLLTRENTPNTRRGVVTDIEVWVPMSNGLVVESITGQAFDLEHAEWHELANARGSLIKLGHVLDDSAHVLDSEIARRLDMMNDRAILVDGVELRVNAPRNPEWDVEKLRAALSGLVSEGRIGAGVPDRCVKTEIRHKTVWRELDKLLQHEDPRVRELVGECRTMVPAVRRVSVKGEKNVNH